MQKGGNGENRLKASGRRLKGRRKVKRQSAKGKSEIDREEKARKEATGLRLQAEGKIDKEERT